MEVTREPSLGAFERASDTLEQARPTARNLACAIARVRQAVLAAGPARMAAAARAAAEAIQREDEAASEALSRHGAALLHELVPERPSATRVLTHCNSGALAASAGGTGLGVIAALAGTRAVEVLVCETRPLLQGARLTVWECARLGIPHVLLADSAAAGLIRRGEVDCVVTGFDRVAANGDVANKVGTYGLALAAHAAGIPFIAAGPSSSVDRSIPDGDAIEIEERDADEVRHAAGALLTLPGTPCRNPAFDVTPAALVTALVTERGVASPVDGTTVAVLA
jgi:methylthioribose-1-phosphate isomerase